MAKPMLHVAEPTRTRAFRAISLSLGYAPHADRRVAAFGGEGLTDVLVRLEREFSIRLEVDETWLLTVDQLLDLVVQRAEDRAYSLYDLSAYRAATGRFARLVDPPLELDPAVLDAAFPKTQCEKPDPARRPLSWTDVGIGVAIGLVIAALGSGAMNRPIPPPSAADQALVAAVR